MICADYKAHEAMGCSHPPAWEGKRFKPRRRVRLADGCEVELCDECWWAESSPMYGGEVVEIAELDRDGIPFDPSAWREGDVVANLLRMSA